MSKRMLKRHKELIKKHRPRLCELGEEAKAIADKWAGGFSNDYEGKVKFALALATAVTVLCKITPILDEATFIDDVRIGTAIWVDAGEPKTDESRTGEATLFDEKLPEGA